MGDIGNMRETEPKVYLIAKPDINEDELVRYLIDVKGLDWIDDVSTVNGKPAWNAAQRIIEFAGRLCYRSWKPGLNPNVKRIRKDSGEYLRNIIKSGHGSVLEHVNYTFVFHDVSRVFTHELARHRAGTAISQESLRFVRLDEIPFWIPDWAQEDEFLTWLIYKHVQQAEALQADLSEHFNLDDPGVPFSEKKAKTSFMRRLAPMGLSTSIVWTANVRTLRHVIAERTKAHVEEEIRLVFDKVARIMKRECPDLFFDFTCVDPDKGVWECLNHKV
jgi:thymidylate synthase (FAD)